MFALPLFIFQGFLGFVLAYSPYSLPYMSDLSQIIPRLSDAAAESFSRGLGFASKGEMSSALVEIQIAAKHQPYHPVLLMSLGSVYYFLEKPDEAISHYQQAVGYGRYGDTAHDLACVRLGKMFIERDNWIGAMDAFRYGVTLYGHLPDALYRLVYLLQFSCDFSRRASLLATVRSTLRAEVKAENFTYMTPSQTLMFLEDSEIALVTKTFAIQNTEVNLISKINLPFWSFTK